MSRLLQRQLDLARLFVHQNLQQADLFLRVAGWAACAGTVIKPQQPFVFPTVDPSTDGITPHIQYGSQLLKGKAACTQ